MLDEPERTSEWLQRKACRRVWEASTIRRPQAMARTPRRVLEEHALLGNWGAFPESPAPYYGALNSAVGQGYYDYRGIPKNATKRPRLAKLVVELEPHELD